MELRKATRKKAKLRVGLSGPSGSGKTYSALLLASGMAPWEKIAVIDTENGSGELYSHLGPYSVITLTAPFSPERYVEAIKACEEAGMEVIVIDSITHEWDGKGGCLEFNDLTAQTKFKGNTWAAWSVTTPKHQKLIAAITASICHIITTARSKTDTIQTEDKKIKKVGLKEIQREGYEYELTVNFTLDRDGHYATASKDRTSIFIELDPFVVSEFTGQTLLAWANEGIGAPNGKLTTDQHGKILELFIKGIKNEDPEVQKKTIIDFLKKSYKVDDISRLTFEQADGLLANLQERFEKLKKSRAEAAGKEVQEPDAVKAVQQVFPGATVVDDAKTPQVKSEK